MAMVVKNNMSAVRTLNTLNSNTNALQKSLQKVSSGMKINSAQDDASGYAISERMRVRIRSLDQANQNTQNDSSLMKTAEGAVGNTVEILRALKEKAINAANDSNTDEDRQTIQKEINQFIDQIDDNALVQFNGKYLIDGSKNNATISSKTILLNQSLKAGTLETDALTDLRNRAGDSLGIQDTDKWQVSWVQNGKINFTSGNVNDASLADILNAAWTDDSNKAFGQVKATTNDGLISKAANPTYESLGTWDGTNVPSAVINLAKASDNFDIATATTFPLADLNLYADKRGAEFTYDADAETGLDADGATAQVEYTPDSDTTKLGTFTITGLKATTEIFGEKTTVATTEVSGYDLSSTIDTLTDESDFATTVMQAIGNVGDPTGNNTSNSVTMKLSDITTTDANGNEIPMFYLSADSSVSAEDVTVTRTINGAWNSGTFTTASDEITFAYTGTDNPAPTKIYQYQPAGTGFDDAPDKFGKAVYTPDKTAGIAVASTGDGVNNQISGLTISILDQDGNVKKAANAALDQFKQYQRAENETGDMSLNFHIGSEANVAIKVGMTDMRSEALGLKGSDGTRIDVFTKEHANSAINVIENALTKALDQQTTIGAIEARLEYTSTNLTTSSENVQAAESTIRDADMAKEMTNYTKSNVLLQAAQAMLAQANQNSSAVLSLLQ